MTTTVTIIREEPPTTGRGTRKRSALSDALIEVAKTPNEWFRIQDYPAGPGRPEDNASTAASALRNGRLATNRPPGTWEFQGGPIDPTSVGYDPTRPYGVWARLVTTVKAARTARPVRSTPPDKETP